MHVALLAAMAAMAAAAAGQLVSPSVNVQVLSAWPFSPIVEAAEFLFDEDPALFWSYIDKAAALAGGDADAILDAAPSGLSNSSRKMLRISLGLGTYSPAAELYSTIAKGCSDPSCGSADSWATYGDKTFCDVASLRTELQTNVLPPTKWSYNCAEFERCFTSLRPSDRKEPVFLFSDISSASFAPFHTLLKGEADAGKIKYVFRHLPQKNVSGEVRTLLRGYGASLTIKNMEYKTLDDLPISTADTDSGEHQEGEETITFEEDKDTEGFILATLAARKPTLLDHLAQFQKHLEKNVSSTNVNIWDMKNIGLAAIQVCVQEEW
jgi:UDP-glucose:glycoprotein glucosyltransferase